MLQDILKDKVSWDILTFCSCKTLVTLEAPQFCKRNDAEEKIALFIRKLPWYRFLDLTEKPRNQPHFLTHFDLNSNKSPRVCFF